MGLISTTRTIVYCLGGVLITGCVGFALNAYFLKLLRDDIKQLMDEIACLKAELKKQSQRAESDDEEEEFHIALESLPSQSSLTLHDAETDCTDRQCDAELLELCRQIDNKHDTLKLTEQGCQQCVTYLKELNIKHPDSPQLIWRLARIMFEEAKHNIRAGLDAKQQLFLALVVAQKSVEVGERNSKCHLWYAILLGDTCKYDDTKTKLTKGVQFDKHVKISLSLDPHNSTALHLLGRYCYEVSGIKWWEAKIAATLFGNVPRSTYDEALEYFIRADDLNSEWVENTLFIIKCLTSLDRKVEARQWLKRLNKMDIGQDLKMQVSELRSKLL